MLIYPKPLPVHGSTMHLGVLNAGWCRRLRSVSQGGISRLRSNVRPGADVQAEFHYKHVASSAITTPLAFSPQRFFLGQKITINGGRAVLEESTRRDRVIIAVGSLNPRTLGVYSPCPSPPTGAKLALFDACCCGAGAMGQLGYTSISR